MHFARFTGDDRIAYGIMEGDTVEEISSTPFLPYERTGISHDLSDVRLLAPCLPSKIVAIGVNYRDHAEEMGREPPEIPMAFFKPSTAVIGHQGVILRPPGCRELHYEGELGVVVGSVARRVPRGDFDQVVLGYTCALDITARDFQAVDFQWARAKGFDTSAPLGPVIASDLDATGLSLTTRVNGDVKQDSKTDQLIFDVGSLVEFVTRYITLLPGDVIMTGTPSGVGPLNEGDLVEVEIEGIGTLEAAVGGGEG
jgi:2-keto-4-pentenoate hydratase/2-oxohepta-3-ene-1,7-dioic acid hydratase in catechol pathway